MFDSDVRGSRPSRPKPHGFASRPKPRPRPQHHAPVHHYNPPAPQHHYNPPARPQPHYNPPPQRPSSGGQFRTGGGGRPHSSPGNAGQGKVAGPGNKGGGGGNKPAPAPKPQAPTVDKFLHGDVAYQQGLSELMRTLNQFNTQNKSQRGDVREAFSTAMERMGDERTKSLEALKDDFASRNLLTSGLYTDATSDYNTEYNQRVQDLNKDQQSQLENLLTERSNFASLNQSKRADLRLDAIRRRAEKFNLK